MFNFLRRNRQEPTPEQIGEWVRSSMHRGLICSECGNTTDSDDTHCSNCGRYLNGVIDKAVEDAIQTARRQT